MERGTYKTIACNELEIYYVFAVCKNGGGRPGGFSHVHDVRLTGGRHRGSGARLQICSAPTHTTHKLARKSSRTFVCTGSDEHSWA